MVGGTDLDDGRIRASVPAWLARFLHQLALERMLGAVTGLREIAVGALLEGVRIAMRQLASHGIIAGLGAFVRFAGTFSAVGIVAEMISGVRRHKALSN
jgi:hypothetical protein